jgi:hypothetical protein
MCALRLSKKYRETLDKVDLRDGGVRNDTSDVVRNDTNDRYEMIPANKGRDREGGDIKTRDLAVAASRDDQALGKVVEKIEEQYKTRRRQRVERVERFSPTAFRHVYNAAIAEYRQESKRPVAICSPREAKMFAKSVANDAFYQEGDQWKKYVYECIFEWDWFRDYFDRFIKRLVMPETPNFMFFLRMNTRWFAPAYIERKDGTAARMVRTTDNRANLAQRKQAEAEEALREMEDLYQTTQLELKREKEAYLVGVHLARQRARREAEEKYRPKLELTEEQIAAAYSDEELPDWEELQKRGK